MIYKKSKGAYPMKRKTHSPFLCWLRTALLAAALLCASAGACADEGHRAQAWLEQFAQALAGMEPLNDPQATADPARAGEYLLEYAFGTVTAQSAAVTDGRHILCVDVRTPEVTDWRGVRVGMGLAAAMDGRQAPLSSTQLYVLDMPDAQNGWSWAYVDEGGVYGVEYIAYAGSGAEMTEYTLTYVLEAERISAIRVKAAPSTQAQAQEAINTAREIASRQHGEVLAARNGQTMLAAQDLTVMGIAALGAEVADLVLRMGEPDDIQTLPAGGGRILLYGGAAVTLNLEERTGREIVRGVSVTDGRLEGPRGLTVGMTVQEAAALFRCDQDVSSLGGVLYLEGEAMGEAPCGELKASGMGEVTLRYACLTQGREEAVLEIGVKESAVTYWQLFYRSDREEGVW